MIVLAVIEEDRPLPAGVTVVAHVRATGPVSGRHFLDGKPHVAQAGSMLLTIPEAADELRLSTRAVERLVKAGDLPSVVIGSARRIDRDDLRAFIVEHREPATSFRDRIAVKVAPASPAHRPAGRRAAGAGALSPAGAQVSRPRGAS